jgi:hypothetical protein
MKLPRRTWPLRQCPECFMIFALPPFGDWVGERAIELVERELLRHIEENHPRLVGSLNLNF